MSSKKLLDAQPSKLARRQEEETAEDRPALSTRRPVSRQPKSFRLSPADIARLQQLSASLTAEAGRYDHPDRRAQGVAADGRGG